MLLTAGQVVVPEELRFPHACCVGIASQTTLSLFNPSDSWQKVSITVTSLAIDGEKVIVKYSVVVYSGLKQLLCCDSYKLDISHRFDQSSFK